MVLPGPISGAPFETDAYVRPSPNEQVERGHVRLEPSDTLTITIVGRTPIVRTARPTTALWRIVMVRIAHDPETQFYFERRVKEGKTKPEVIRILKRYVAREVYRYLPRG